MRKFRYESRSFASVKPGDLFLLSFGVMPLESIEPIGTDHYAMTFRFANSVYRETCHSSNWPDVVTGFTAEYQAAYPDAVFPAG